MKTHLMFFSSASLNGIMVSNQHKSNYHRDRFVERGAQKIKRTDAAIANKPPIDELAGTRVFRE